MTEARADLPLPQGTLDLLILKVVALGCLDGYAIAQRLQQISRDVVQVQQGSLYPALHRLENRGLLAAEWKESDTGREAKFYRLTGKGAPASQWRKRSGAGCARRSLSSWRLAKEAPDGPPGPPFRRRRLEAQLDAELRDHLERQAADHVRAGLGEAEARRRARSSSGASSR